MCSEGKQAEYIGRYIYKKRGWYGIQGVKMCMVVIENGYG
jgi:hypothetical protein